MEYYFFENLSLPLRAQHHLCKVLNADDINNDNDDFNDDKDEDDCEDDDDDNVENQCDDNSDYD